ncbi:hypothetical protein F4777DRAFT_584478 [Nemania sp. FL0916]|nr:hypothetical protein F4777DRAFT_584478 [Nemania sp. FL0916]
MSSNEPPKRREARRDRAVEAARWLWETQKAQLAEDPNRPRSTIESTRTAAEKFGACKSTVARQLVALKKGKPNASSGIRVGRPARLTELEEQLLNFHIFMLRRKGQRVTSQVVQDTADTLLFRRNPPAKPISDTWVKKWMQADRMAARREAKAKLDGVPPAAAPAEAVAEDDEDDGDTDDDASNELEATGSILGSPEHGTSSLSFAPITTNGDKQLANNAAEALTTIQAPIPTQYGTPTGSWT